METSLKTHFSLASPILPYHDQKEVKDNFCEMLFYT